LPYAEEVRVLDKIIDRIAQEVGISKETVTQAFFRALLEGEFFEDAEVRELFEKTFGSEFLDDLAELPMSWFPLSTDREKFERKYGLG
jgi:hypothetical protein